MASKEISKIVAGHFEEHNKLGLKPNFQKFQVTEDLRNPKRRLIAGCRRSTINCGKDVFP